MGLIAIADAHVLCREALCDFIRHADRNVTVTGFSDYQGLCRYVKDERPDVVLICHDLPGLEQEALARDFGSGDDCPKLGLIVPLDGRNLFSDFPFSGVFSRSLSSKDFLAGLQVMMSGRTFRPLDGGAEGSFKQRPQDFNLTTREKEVLRFLAKGASNKEIARALGLQVVTVKLHIRGICRKTKAANRTQAALIAVENGWT